MSRVIGGSLPSIVPNTWSGADIPVFGLRDQAEIAAIRGWPPAPKPMHAFIGINYTLLFGDPTEPFINKTASGFGTYPTSVYYDTVTGDLWVATSSGNKLVYKSTNHGTTFVASTTIPNVNYRNVAANNGVVIAGQEGGNYYALSTDRGQTWTGLTPSGSLSSTVQYWRAIKFIGTTVWAWVYYFNGIGAIIKTSTPTISNSWVQVAYSNNLQDTALTAIGFEYGGTQYLAVMRNNYYAVISSSSVTWLGTNSSPLGLAYTPSNGAVYLQHYGGQIYRSLPPYTSQSTRTSNSAAGRRSIFSRGDTLISIGDNAGAGRATMSTDGASTWTGIAAWDSVPNNNYIADYIGTLS